MMEIQKFLSSAATLNRPFKEAIQVTGGTPPYKFQHTAPFPPGLVLGTDGVLQGKATQPGTAIVPVTVTDAKNESVTSDVVVTAIDKFTLPNTTVEQEQFVTALQELVARRGVWSTGIATQTSQTLIELIAAVGTYNTARILRATEDAFDETVQSPYAARAITLMKGIRLQRKSPSQVLVTVTNSSDRAVTLPEFTQFISGGVKLFTPEVITLPPNESVQISLKEGTVVEHKAVGLGTDHQSFIPTEHQFKVADSFVHVAVDGINLIRVSGGLWNYKNVAAFEDSTLPDGRLKIQFGAQNYGCVPAEGAKIDVRYVVTVGAQHSNLKLSAQIRCPGNESITGIPTNAPVLTGGSNERNSLAYRARSTGAFGAHGAALNKSQYTALVNSYAGVLDAVVLAQRDLDPTQLKLMNTVYVCALTSDPWSEPEKEKYLRYVSDLSLYQPHLRWLEPTKFDWSIDITVHVYKSSAHPLQDVAKSAEDAISALLAPRPGSLGRSVYVEDIINAVRGDKANSSVSHVTFNLPLEDAVLDRTDQYVSLSQLRVTPVHSDRVRIV